MLNNQDYKRFIFKQANDRRKSGRVEVVETQIRHDE